MLKNIITLLCAMLIFNTLWACDICGCAAGSNSLGILPGFKKHFVALRWNERSFTSSHTPSLSEDGSYTATETSSKEYFNTLDVWGRFNVHKRLQLYAFVPFSVHAKIDNEFGTDRF